MSTRGNAAGVDPFGAEPNPALYVARDATEEALGALQRALAGGSRVLALSGPRGLGKRTILRVLEGRLQSDFRAIHLTYVALPMRELSSLALGMLGQEPTGDPERDLLRIASAGPPLVLLMDDLAALPIETAEQLAARIEEADGALRVVTRLADAHGREVLTALGAQQEIELTAAMTEEETRKFLVERLELAQAPDRLRLRFHDQVRERLHREAEGVPAAVAALARQHADAPRAESAPPEGAARADPFGPGAGRTVYQARPATEALLGELESELRAGRTTLLVSGPPGLGKTTLLRVLAGRLGHPFRSLEMPFPSFDPPEFWSYVLFELGAASSDDPEDQVRSAVERLRRLGAVLVLLIDEAHSLPESTCKRLAELIESGGGALRAVLAVHADAPRKHLALLPDLKPLAFDEPLSADESAAYVKGRLDQFAAPDEVQRRFDSGTLSSLFRASRGVPRELNRLAGEVERVSPAQAGAAVATAPAPEPEEAPTPPPLKRAPKRPKRAKRAKREKSPPAAARAEKTEPIEQPPEHTPEPALQPPERTAQPERSAERVAPPRRASGAPEPRASSAAPGPQRAQQVVGGALSLVPHFGLAICTPLALIVLWLWLGPVFGPAPTGEPSAPSAEQPAPAGLAATVAVNVNATPWAEIEIDGAPVGSTPIGNHPLEEGTHEFRATLPDGRVLTRQVRVDRDNRYVTFP